MILQVFRQAPSNHSPVFPLFPPALKIFPFIFYIHLYYRSQKFSSNKVKSDKVGLFKILEHDTLYKEDEKKLSKMNGFTYNLLVKLFLCPKYITALSY